MKKIFAILLAVSMIMAFALTASAAETTLPDLDCSGWWTAHSEGVEVTEEGITITYTSTTYENAADDNGDMKNWFGPLWVLYTNDEAKIGVLGEGAYAEYWVHRVDNYGWIGALNRWSPEADLTAAGITITAVDNRTDAWANFAADLKAGITCTLTAKLDGSNAIVTYDANGIYTTITLPVDTSKPVYLSLTGEQAKMTNIVVTTPDAEPETPVEPASGYTAGLSYADADWSFQTWGDAKTSVDGAGTYTLSYDLTADAESAVVLVIDIGEEGGDAADVLGALNLTELKLTADGVEIPVDLTKVAVGNLEGKGRYRIEIYNEYGSTKENSPIDLSLLKASSNVTVTFTLADPNAVQPDPEPPVTPDPENPKDGDSISVFVALMAVSAVGAAVVLKKKSF